MEVDLTSPLVQICMYIRPKTTIEKSCAQQHTHKRELHNINVLKCVLESLRTSAKKIIYCVVESIIYLSGRKTCGSSHTSSIVCSRRMGMTILIPLGISSPFTVTD